MFLLTPDVFMMANSSSATCPKKHRVPSPGVCPMLPGPTFTKYQQLLLWLCKHFQGWGVRLGPAGCPAWGENKLFLSEDHALYLAGKVLGVVCLVLAQCLLVNIIGR